MNPNDAFKNKHRKIFMPERNRVKGVGTIFSSNGEIEVNLRTGKILKVHAEEAGFEDWAATVTFFDMDEYRDYYSDPTGKDDSFDILDLGFWTTGGKYVPPEKKYRAEIEKDYKRCGL